MSLALVWLRRDLRLADNPALQAALDAGHTPLPVYIHDSNPGLKPGAATAWWLHHSLLSLQQSLLQRGSDLLLLEGDSRACLPELARQTNAAAVFWNRRYEPSAIALDQDIKSLLQAACCPVESFGGALLSEPWRLYKANGDPYRVFTPFWKALQQQVALHPPVHAPDTLPPVPAVAGLSVDDLQLLPRIAWYEGFPGHWRPGEAGAWDMLDRFCSDALLDYGTDRDRPDLPGTSRLSPHLHFGEISPRQVWRHIQAWSGSDTTPGAVAAAEGFLRQLAWREFAGHLLYHFPHTASEPLVERYRRFPWRTRYQTELRAWQQGLTGIPIVDAGMRELWHTGWMHNRLRMIVASLLTKNLLIPWQVGASWFLDTLVDADLANNTLGWQWTAGCGADAAPYFRIFNPVRQGKRFDPEGAYTRQWVPELERLPARWVHHPWEAPGEVLAGAGLRLGKDYPEPIVDLQTSRARALEAWDQIKRQDA